MRKTPTIAVIDDDRSVGVSIASLLHSMDYSAEVFGSAAEFMASPLRGGADCVITDMQMPEVNGLELQALLNCEPSPPALIFISAFMDERKREQALQNGAVCFLSKPFCTEAMIKCVERALAARPG